MTLRSALLLVAAATLGCGSPAKPTDPDTVSLIRATTSFGFCLGYCRTTLEITPAGLDFLEEDPRGELPARRRTGQVSAAEWAALEAAVDRPRLEGLPGVFGCPDCADAGAESVEVFGLDCSKRVTFDHGAPMPELQPLLGQVRALRARVEP